MAKDILGASIIYRLSRGQIKFVLIQDRFGKWTFPKGKSHRGEKPEITAIREASEETGLSNLEITAYLDKITYTAERRDKVVYFYLVKSLDRGAKLAPDSNEGIKKAVWKNHLDAMKMLDYDNFVSCFKEALTYLGV